MELAKPKVLIFAQWFLPGVKAGGPITSVANLVKLLADKIDFFVVCSAYDLGSTQPYKLPLNTWIKSQGINTFYTTRNLNFSSVSQIIKQINPNCIYLNSLFSLQYTLLPILVAKKLNVEIVLAPRGMLAKTALAQKKTEKKYFFKAFNIVF